MGERNDARRSRHVPLARPSAEVLDRSPLGLEVRARSLEPLGIIAAGSVVRGAGDRASDLDIYVVHERPYRQRLQRWFGDVPVEIFVNPIRAIREYFAR